MELMVVQCFMTMTKKYDVYNEEQCNTRYSPYSTFKIVAVLEGLNDGVLISKNTKMKYNGEISF